MRGRLPDDVRPQHYHLQLDVDPRRERFAGIAEIRVEVRRPLSAIWLHGQGLAVSEASIEMGGRTLAARYEEVDPQSGIARLALDGTLPSGVATLRLAWTAGFRPGGEALYRTRAGDEWYAFTQLQPINARRAFPGFDEPRFKTPFEVVVLARVSDRVITNAPLAGTEPRPDGRVLHVFRPTLPLPTYLLALAIGPLDVVEATLPPNAVRDIAVPLRGVATRGKGPQLAYALRHTPPMVDRLEAYFGIPYPYPKLDLIASPEQPGAMENAGAIIYADTLLLLDQSAPPAQQRSLFEVHAHELAHHWFGDLVTPEWWDDIWLNESFASWMGVKVAEELRPDLRVGELAVAAVTFAMDVDSKRAGRPIRQPVTDNLQITDTFDSITYLKGGGVLSMVESWLGHESFRDGVRLHLRRHEHGSATSDDFFAALAESARQPAVVEVFRTFVDQPGVPLVSLEATDGGEWRATQQRYRPVGSAVALGQLWKIPLCVRGSAGGPLAAPSCSLLAGATGTLGLRTTGSPVMPNANGAGYYRFSLPEPELTRLVAVAAKLPAPGAIMLADSVAAEFRAGRLSFASLLAAARELAASPSRPAAILLGGEIVDIRDRWADEATRADLSGVIRELYGPQLASLGLDPRRGAYAGAPAEERLLRQTLASLVALHGSDPALRARLAAAARASLDDPAALDPEFRALAWTVGVQDLGTPFAGSLEAAMLSSWDSLLRLHAARARRRGRSRYLGTRARAGAGRAGTDERDVRPARRTVRGSRDPRRRLGVVRRELRRGDAAAAGLRAGLRARARGAVLRRRPTGGDCTGARATRAGTGGRKPAVTARDRGHRPLRGASRGARTVGVSSARQTVNGSRAAQALEAAPPGAAARMALLASLAALGACATPPSLPDPLEAGWNGAAVCEKLDEDPDQRVLRCSFPPGVGHERHYHGPHFGYALAGGRMRITDARGTREVEIATGSSFRSAGVDWHEVLNVGDTTVTYLIVERK